MPKTEIQSHARVPLHKRYNKLFLCNKNALFYPITAIHGNVQPSPQHPLHAQIIIKHTIPKVVSPDDFVVPQGKLTSVNRSSPSLPSDLYHCPGCNDPQCSTDNGGCAQSSWRFQSSGYLREILTSKVYDVASETPLQHAKSLSKSLGNQIYLKREDLQPVKSFKILFFYRRPRNCCSRDSTSM